MASVFCALLLLISTRSYGQDGASGPQAALTSSAAQGVRAVNEDRAEEAVSLLQPAFEADAAFRLEDGASAAYWLGRAYELMGQEALALSTWRRGLLALRDAGGAPRRFVADAFVRSVFDRRDVPNYGEAQAAYFYLLRSADDAALAEEEAALVARHVEAVTYVLPPAARRRIGLASTPSEDRSEKSSAYVLKQLTPDAGAYLVTWWRGQDPLPATAENERVEEHLERVAYARQHYRERERPDDRGRIYIRLGEPYKKASISRSKLDFLKGPDAPAGAYAGNEFWMYRDINQHAHYFFTEARSNYYEITPPSKFLPPEVRMATPRRAGSYLRGMETIYSQLSLLHEHYAQPYIDFANAVTELDLRVLTGGPVSISGRKPFTMAQSFSMQVNNEEAITEARREESVPPSFSRVLEDATPLPMSVRWARFLNPDGTTRVELYWATTLEALWQDRYEMRPDDQYLLSAAYVQEGSDHERQQTAQKRLLIPQHEGALGARATIDPQTHAMSTASDTFHVAAQWDEFLARRSKADGRSVQLGRRLKRNAFRADSIPALNADEAVLEISDLKPLLMPENGSVTELETQPPYPFDAITPRTPLALYFEVYHLAFGEDDRTRYTIEYDIVQTMERQGIAQLFRNDDVQRTATRSEYAGASRTTEEYIVIDLSEWKERDGTLSVVVRVTDETTGRQAERSIDFRAVPDPSDE